MSATIERLRELITARVSKLHTEIADLQRRLRSLDGGDRLPSRRRAPAGKPLRNKGAKRAARRQRGEEFLAAVKGQPGQTTTEPAQQTGTVRVKLKAWPGKAVPTNSSTNAIAGTTPRVQPS